jgi:hypothetical protein
MAAVAFDTLKFVNKLEAVGVPRPQAVAEAEVLSEIFDLNLRELATKEDVNREISSLRHDMEKMFIGLKAEISMLKWGLGAIIGGVLALVARAFF